MFLGIDVGGTKIASGLVTEKGQLLSKTRELLDKNSETSAVEQLKHVIAGYDLTSVEAIGISIPGIASIESGTVWAPNIPGWDHVPLAQMLSSHIPQPLIIESDRNCAVLGETLYGAGVGFKDVVFLILGTGIGAGILTGGELLRGSRDIGGAVGWIPVSHADRRRHFEDVASGPAIERAAHETLHIDCSLPGLVELAREGHHRLIAIFEEAGEAIGHVLSILISTLNPGLVVLGGGVSNAWDLLAPSALPTMRLWSQPIAVQQVEIVQSQLGESAGVLGAAAVARYQLKRGPITGA